MLRCHHNYVMCSGFQYLECDYVCYPTYLGLYKILNVPTGCTLSSSVDSFISVRCVRYDYKWDYTVTWLQPTSVSRRKVLPSELTNTVTNITEQFNVYVHRNEAHFTYIFVSHQCTTLRTFTKPLPHVIFTYLFCYFNSLFGSTHDSADYWSAHSAPRPHMPVRQLRECARMMHGWVSSVGWPLKQKSWLRRLRLYLIWVILELFASHIL